MVRCSHLTGKIHDIGLEFDRPVKHGWYDSAGTDMGQAGANLPKGSGKILFVTASRSEADLMRFTLDQMELDLVTETNANGALKAVEGSSFQIILVSPWLEDGMGGLEFVKTLREREYPFPVVAISSGSEDGFEERAKALGCTDVLNDPFDFNELVPLVCKYVACRGSDSDEPLVSARWAEVRMRPLILRYLEDLQRIITKLDQFLVKGDLQAMVKLCRQIRATAGGYGYPEIAEDADSLEKHIADNSEREALRRSYAALAGRCASAGQIRTSSNNHQNDA